MCVFGKISALKISSYIQGFYVFFILLKYLELVIDSFEMF